MKILLTFFTLIWMVLPSYSQETVWVFFKDKGAESGSRLEDPSQFLSHAALDRRAAKNIPVTLSDLPVEATYLKTLKSRNFEVLSASRWLNAAAVRMDCSRREEILALDFVSGLRPVASLVRTSESEDLVADIQTGYSPLLYGQAEEQNNMLNIAGLHERGFTGKGVKIAVMDAGFRGADTISAFDSMRAENRILATWDFVDNDETVYHSDAHGTQVLSVIAANMPGQLVGTAPHVSVVLFRTENSRSETRQEEYNWVKAVEMADSMGVDIIHSSLGYNEFDNEEDSYSYEDMNGNTAITSQAADAAARKGIIVTVSAGNEGDNHWKYIVAPCDADSVLCVGSVDRLQNLSGFSSVGPSSDGRIKPDVVAMGSRTMAANPNNRIYGVNGTSFSGPLIAGFTACLRQAHPERSNIDIIRAVRLSGDQAGLPDAQYGYGIPDALKADSLLANVSDLTTVKIVTEEKPIRGEIVERKSLLQNIETEITFTPNPLTVVIVGKSQVSISTENAGASIVSYTFYRGKQKLTVSGSELKNDGNTLTLSTKYLQKGLYYIDIVTDKFEEKISFEIL
ncbi:MAG: S8 family serine peptidase [Bacteroidia bacterium]|nr:S8 family serine peptidase [Bacteroidia bacterium]